LVAWLLLWRLPGWTSSAEGHAGARPSVCVVVPARNEERALPRLLESLRDQRFRPDQIVVVDDHSTDRTAEVVRRYPEVTVIASRPLPDGWTGKCWACWQGAQAAAGEIIVFIDADVVLGPEALERAVDEHAGRGGLLSVQPLHRVGSWVESLSLPFNVVAVMGIGVGAAIATAPTRAAAGPFMVCGRDDYLAVDGHRAVRGEVVEDLALGRRFDEHALPVTCLAGVADVSFRMYAGGWRDLVTGWSKNFATGARFTPVVRGVAVALWITASLTAAWWIVEQAASGWPGAAVAAVVYVAFAAQYAVLGYRVGRFGPAALAWPLLVTFFTAVFAWSLVATFVLRRVRWRDRIIPIARGRAARPVRSA
jgi:4,4'-diaponeurosporenoate glycosyltransferase